MGNNFFTICSFFYSLMLGIIYYRRKHIQSLETKIYSKLVFINFMNVFFAVLCYFTILVRETFPFINDFVSKTLLVFYISWVLLFTMYLFVIVSKNDNLLEEEVKKNKLLLTVLSVALLICIYYLPLYYHSANNVVYSYGPSANLIYGITGVLMFVWVILMLKDFKILKTKKCIPIILFIFLAIMAVAIQKINPGLLLITAVETFITVIMYFTIENPDMKLLEEVHKSKEISDTANEEKTLFLYNMAQEIRNTMNDINDNADMILESDSLDEDKDCAREIKGITSKFNSMINEMFDVSKLDAANIKVYNSKYNVKNILKEIVTVYNKICRDFNCAFPPYVEYGEGLYVSHSHGIVIGRTAIIGKRCKIYPHCTIIASLKGDEERKKTGQRRHAKIGDDCILGCKSTIIGPINIGDDVTIAAGAIVTKDVPSHTVVKNVNEFRAKRKEEILEIYKMV